MSRPLWEAYVIEGLDKIPNLPMGCFAIYTKLHHSLVDGARGSNILALLHDLEPTPPAAEDEQPVHLADTPPSMAELLSKASVNGVKNSLGLARGTVASSFSLGKYGLGLARGTIPLPEITAPRSRFNGPVGPHRVFDAAEFKLADFKRVKDAAEVKLNDVALAVIGGAMLSYVEAKGETPAGELTATVPLNMRNRRDLSDDHNQVGSVFTSLHTQQRDPVARLKAVHASARNAKTWGEQSPLVDAIKLAGTVSPFISRSVAQLWSRYQVSQHLSASVSTVVSNVPAPPFPLYCAGAHMVDYYGLGVLTPGVGIFHLVFSYGDKVTLSVLADREMLPDPEFYRSCLERAFEELDLATRPPRKRAATKKKPSSKRKA